jgi:hypothetical protein
VSRKQRERHLEHLNRFTRALNELFEVSDFNEAWGDPRVTPKPGREQEWWGKKGAVDRAAPAAAAAFDAAGVCVEWKPPGTMNRYNINPASNWSTVLDGHPRFELWVLEAVCNQAAGSLEAGVNEPKRQILPAGAASHAIVWTLGIVGTVIAGLIVAGLAYRWGWAS